MPGSSGVTDSPSSLPGLRLPHPPPPGLHEASSSSRPEKPQAHQQLPRGQPGSCCHAHPSIGVLPAGPLSLLSLPQRWLEDHAAPPGGAVCAQAGRQRPLLAVSALCSLAGSTSSVEASPSSSVESLLPRTSGIMGPKMRTQPSECWQLGERGVGTCSHLASPPPAALALFGQPASHAQVGVGSRCPQASSGIKLSCQ